MKTTNVMYAKLDIDFNLADGNSLFKEMFLNKKYLVVQDYCSGESQLADLENLSSLNELGINACNDNADSNIDTAPKGATFNILNLAPNFKGILQSCEVNQLRSALLLKNDCIRNDSTKKDAALMFFYATILKTQDSYVIRMVNWFNWVRVLHAAMNQSYEYANNLDNVVNSEDFTQLSAAACFKAFAPLIGHLPIKYIKGLEHGVLFDILHTFINLKNGNKVNKDYTRNIQYRVKTDLKKLFNLNYADMFDIIGSDRLFCVKDGEDIKISKTQIKENLAHFIPNDVLLDNFINLLHPLQTI